MKEEVLIRLLDGIVRRQDAIMDMLDNFMEIYAKDNNHKIEIVEEEGGYINDLEGFDN